VSEERIKKSFEKNVASLNWATIPLFFIFIVLGESILLLIITLNFFWGLSGSSTLFPGINIFQTQLVGVIVGSLLTLFSSYLLFSLKHLQELKSISRGFISELHKYQNNIQSFVDDYSNGIATTVNINLLQEMNRPIFDNDSLYYSLRKEMYKFDEGIVDRLLQFYSLLMTAEEERRRLFNLREDFMKKPTHIIAVQTHMFETLQKANSLTPDLIKDLACIIDRKI